MKICTIEGCQRPHSARGVCDYHYYHLMKDHSLKRRKMAERGKGTVTPQGYVRLYIDGKKVGAHRKIMSQIIGRPLLREEEVHHINGIRGDNRPENLELWTTSQPKGKRVKDLLIWAKELIKKYENTESIKN